MKTLDETINELIKEFGLNLNEKSYSDNLHIREAFKNERSELRFLRTGPNRAVNDVGDLLTIKWREPLTYKKANGDIFQSRLDLSAHTGVAIYEVYLPKNPGWHKKEPFSSKELETVSEEIRYGLYMLDAESVLFYEREYIEYLMEIPSLRAYESFEGGH